MNKKKLPILIIIPHGGYNVPEELSGYEDLDRFDLFMNSDAYANDIFDFHESALFCLNSSVSRLFVDLDRQYTELPPATLDGVIKKETLKLKKIFKDGFFPDEIAITNILKRYYFSFHETIEKILKTEDIKLILDCHTMLPIGPESSEDSWMPRPIILMENITEMNGKKTNTCSMTIMETLVDSMNKSFINEKETVTDRIKINNPLFNGYILRRYGNGITPMVRLSVSRSLFLNEKYFSHDFLKVDEYRIRHIRGLLWEAIEKFYRKIFR